MNKHQIAKLDSLKLIVKESENNPDSIARIPKFAMVVDRIKEICADIDACQIVQQKDLTGITTDKELALENLSDSSIEIAGALYSLAHDQNNHTLMARVNFKPTKIGNMNQSDLLATAGIILDEATKISGDELVNEGISTEELTNYRELINFFDTIKSSKKEAVIDRSGTTERLSKLFEEANTLVKNKLDRLALQFKRKDPEFYLKYKAARTTHYRTPTKEAMNKNDTGAKE